MTLPNIAVATGTASHTPMFVLRVPEYCFELQPLDYARLVHQRCPGAVIFSGRFATKKGKKGKKGDGSPNVIWQDRRWSPGALATRQVDLARFKFMSFATWPVLKPGQPKVKKLLETAVSISAFWVDLDFYDVDGWKGASPTQVVEAVRNICAERGWPRPSYATHSGRGVLVVWLTAPQLAQAVMERHRAVQQTLHEAFRDMGSDPSARPLTKTFRMPRTYNEKSGLAVSIIYPDLIREIERVDFDEMCRAVLPFARRTKAQRDADKAEAKAKREADRAARAARKPREGRHGALLTGSSYWETIRADLECLFVHRHGRKGIVDGKSRGDYGAGRHTWLLAMTYAAAWVLHPDELDQFVLETADRLGIDRADAPDKVCSVTSRAREAARGKRKTWKGIVVDPRYKISPAALIELLNVTPMEMRRAGLRILVDQARRTENAVGRVVASRRAKGVKARDAQQAHRLHVGQQAMQMRDLGMTVKAVAELYGVSPRWIDNALRDARAVAGITAARPASAPAPEPIIVTDVGDTLDMPAEPPVAVAHEVLRDIRPRAGSGVVAGLDLTYSRTVTTKGSTLLRPTPAACLPARRALPCPVPS
ncbi:hypothetical protein [Methylobacterium sp. yr596]|uniref:hypothetical protein n=1 Tax=Methylobacterium sp. yr596 TaxID=1761800 RepID=UPI0008EE5581|nr:hypothetical protein [Methylobacterium sp. yr596]SFE90830.1 Homeodomain-like domain-containing protein [Methylobacterium sp. yr596]